jgi:hypothetical protein
MQRINKTQILIGIIGLLIGSLVYLIDRPSNHTYFVSSSPINISLSNVIPSLFGSIGNSLPEFIHVFSFILITAGLIFCRKRGYLIICVSWFLIDCAFELGQKLDMWSSSLVPGWFDGIPFLENTKNFFLQRTFDFFDMAAIALGSIAAYFVLLGTMERRYT